ncbi:ribonuclease H family protein [Oceanivirga salmonicida]|uniref:ribonuclease H family protein n=1 Tax=Oceanivirga salmonicida TaxID=1769291 RepID=UPI00082F59EC|nr:ribonuclease H family protein [Oceanivirga salmonicida]
MFYAYYIEKIDEKGIVDTWEICSQKIKGQKSRYKKFKTYEEAKIWLDNGALYEKKVLDKSGLIKDAIYFDAGTGRGIGVEVRLTDINGKSLLNKIMPIDKINEHGNYLLSSGRTNNFGELTGLFIALKYAKKYNIKNICGDSDLVIKYWCKGHYNKDNLEKETVELIKKVSIMYGEYIGYGGKLHKVSGDINPSDLGFHK